MQNGGETAIAKAIRYMCEIRSISVNRLASRSGLSQSTVDSILKGKSVNPTVTTIDKIAKGLMISREDFMEIVDAASEDLLPYPCDSPGTLGPIYMSFDRDILADNMATLRGRAGLTQGQVANVLSILPRSYERYESGDKVPDIGTLIALADYFGVSLDSLVGRSRAED